MTCIPDLGAHRAPAIECEPVADQRKDAHTIRMPEPGRWEAFEANARKLSSNPTKLMNAFAAWVNREPGARLPQRLDAEFTVRTSDVAGD